MSFKHSARKTSRGGGGKHPPPMRIRVNLYSPFWDAFHTLFAKQIRIIKDNYSRGRRKISHFVLFVL